MRPARSAAFAGLACVALLASGDGGAADTAALDARLDGIVDLFDPDYLARPIDVSKLPLEYATTVVHGRGERVLYTFEDPECGYCRALVRRVAAVGNVTVHTFVVALFDDTSRAKADAVWCAEDRGAAWVAAMTTEIPPPPAPDGCAAPLAETAHLAELLGVSFTPTMFFADGSRVLGLKSRDEIERRVAEAAAPSIPPPGLAADSAGKPAARAQPGGALRSTSRP